MEADKIYDALESYQPGQQDADAAEYSAVREQLLADEVLRKQFEKSQDLDERLIEVFADLPVADDLRDRLQQAIDKAAVLPGVAIDECCESVGTTTDQQVQVAPNEEKQVGKFGQTLRWMAVVASLLVAVVIWQKYQHVEPISPESLVGQATDWTKQVMSPGQQWNSDLQQSPSAYPVDDHVLPPVQRWSQLKTSVDRQTVVYDLSSAKTGRLLLFVCHTRQPYQLPQIALRELMGSGPLTVGAWQDGDLLYVMVGRRNGPGLRRFIRQRLLGQVLRPTLPTV